MKNSKGANNNNNNNNNNNISIYLSIYFICFFWSIYGSYIYLSIYLLTKICSYQSISRCLERGSWKTFPVGMHRSLYNLALRNNLFYWFFLLWHAFQDSTDQSKATDLRFSEIDRIYLYFVADMTSAVTKIDSSRSISSSSSSRRSRDRSKYIFWEYHYYH